MKSKVRKFVRRQIDGARRNPTVFSLRITVLLLASALFALQRNFWTPDTLFIVLLVLAVVFGQAKAFITRFAPFLALLLVYDSFRGIADDLNTNVHFMEMVDADRWLFGGALPTVVLQSWWWDGSVNWYDFYFYFLYTIHFLAPVLLAVLIWKSRPRLYWQFVWSLVGLSFAAFITYIIFPAAPPWMSSNIGLIEPIYRVSSDVWGAMGVTNFSEVYSQMSPNPVAAVPSLHSAYPLLFSLFLVRMYGLRKLWWIFLYPISMWIGVVYMGEHYVIDVILGALYAALAFVAAERFFRWYNSPEQRLKRWLLTGKAKLTGLVRKS